VLLPLRRSTRRVCCKTEARRASKHPLSVVHSTREPDLSAAHVAGRHRVTRMTCEAKASADCGHGIRQTCKCIGAGDPTRCDPPPDRAAAATQITRQPPSRRGPPSHRRGQRDVAHASARRGQALSEPCLSRGGAAAQQLRGRAEHRPPRAGSRKTRRAAVARALERRSQLMLQRACCWRARHDTTAGVLLVTAQAASTPSPAASFRSGLQPPSASPWVPPLRPRERLHRAG